VTRPQQTTSGPVRRGLESPPVRRRLAPLALTASVCLVAAGGCATIPASGTVRSLSQPQTQVTQGEDFPQLIPAPPGKNWSAQQIVSGFLAASASFAGHNAIAREYLTPRQARTWNPGWAVTVVSKPIFTPNPLPLHITGQTANQMQEYLVSGQELATLTASGQELIPPPSAKQVIGFPLKLIRVNGQWRIVNPPRRLLLSKSDFLRVYQPRNLYFFASPGGKKKKERERGEETEGVRGRRPTLPRTWSAHCGRDLLAGCSG
jgi:hypothetical protein